METEVSNTLNSTSTQLKQLAKYLNSRGISSKLFQDKVEIYQETTSINRLDKIGSSSNRSYMKSTPEYPLLQWVYEVRMWDADPDVPVLFFTVYIEDESVSRVAGLKDLLGIVTADVSVCEHPKSGLPIMYIHPCNTKKWMTETQASIWLWLVHFGRSANLFLD